MADEIKQKLQSELDELESELRVHLPKEIKRALEFGDLRDFAAEAVTLGAVLKIREHRSDFRTQFIRGGDDSGFEPQN